MSRFVPALCAAACVAALPSVLSAQSESVAKLPPILVEPNKPHVIRTARPVGGDQPTRGARSSRRAAPQPAVATAAPGPAPSLTAATTQQATRTIAQTPGAVAVVPDTAFKT